MIGLVIVQSLKYTSKLGELVISFIDKNCLIIFLLDTLLCTSFTLILIIICPKFKKNNTSTKIKPLCFIFMQDFSVSFNGKCFDHARFYILIDTFYTKPFNLAGKCFSGLPKSNLAYQRVITSFPQQFDFFKKKKSTFATSRFWLFKSPQLLAKGKPKVVWAYTS